MSVKGSRRLDDVGGDQKGLPEVLSCGGHFRAWEYEDRRDKTS